MQALAASAACRPPACGAGVRTRRQARVCRAGALYACAALSHARRCRLTQRAPRPRTPRWMLRGGGAARLPVLCPPCAYRTTHRCASTARHRCNASCIALPRRAAPLAACPCALCAGAGAHGAALSRRFIRADTHASRLAQPLPALSAAPPAKLPPPALLAQLFPAEHCPLTPQLLAYAPFGCALALGRMALWAACFALDNPALVDADAPLDFMIRRCLGVRLVKRPQGIKTRALTNLPMPLL